MVMACASAGAAEAGYMPVVTMLANLHIFRCTRSAARSRHPRFYFFEFLISDSAWLKSAAMA